MIMLIFLCADLLHPDPELRLCLKGVFQHPWVLSKDINFRKSRRVNTMIYPKPTSITKINDNDYNISNITINKEKQTEVNNSIDKANKDNSIRKFTDPVFPVSFSNKTSVKSSLFEKEETGKVGNRKNFFFGTSTYNKDKSLLITNTSKFNKTSKGKDVKEGKGVFYNSLYSKPSQNQNQNQNEYCLYKKTSKEICKLIGKETISTTIPTSPIKKTIKNKTSYFSSSKLTSPSRLIDIKKNNSDSLSSGIMSVRFKNENKSASAKEIFNLEHFEGKENECIRKNDCESGCFNLNRKNSLVIRSR